MRKLYEATGGQPQRWETLGNLGAVKADAGGIAYAISLWRRTIVAGGLTLGVMQQIIGSRDRSSTWSTPGRRSCR
jgi:hypothetical protein